MAPLEHVWRPAFRMIGAAWSTLRLFPDSLLLPLVICGAAVFYAIAFAVLW